MQVTRRLFLASSLPLLYGTPFSLIGAKTERGFSRRGIVITPEDLSWKAWPIRSASAGLNTIALHGSSPKRIINFVNSRSGKQFLTECSRYHLDVEYELHAMRELLPRAVFKSRPDFFRMNEKGERVADANLCVHSEGALQLASDNAVEIGLVLNPTSGRFFYWGDDGAPWCRCQKCVPFNDSEQALLFENHLIGKLRKKWPGAQLAHLAYARTIEPPKKIEPHPGVFLEYAPIHRRYDLPYERQTNEKDRLDLLSQNLEVFPKNTAQVLEYWMDVSRFSHWIRPAVKLPWHREAFEADVQTYRRLGIRNATSFGVFIDSDYISRFGEPAELFQYGDGLRGIR